MKTEYGTDWRVAVFARALALALAGVLFVAGHAAAQAPPMGPAAPADPDIIGGREATPGAWPWQVALLTRAMNDPYLAQFCGGTIIDPEWVLTAAHCLEDISADRVDVLVGAHRLSDSGVRVSASLKISHPDYNAFSNDNDLALLRLSTPVTYTPISLFTVVSDITELDFMRGTVIGWGAEDGGYWVPYPDALREVALPLVDNAQCALNSYYGPITDNMICAGYDTLTKGACYGDSGGPLMVQKADASWAQVGIVSFGPYGCTGIEQYDVFTRVSRYTEWLTMCMATPNSLPCTGVDDHEPDNEPANAQQLTGPITYQMHTFHESGDQDWLRLDVETGKDYIFMTGRLTETAPTLRPVIWLFAADGFTPITYTEGSEYWWEPWTPDFQESARLLWRADRSGPIYVAIELLPDLSGQVYGPRTRYWLTVSDYSYWHIPAILAPAASAPAEPGAVPPGQTRTQ